MKCEECRELLVAYHKGELDDERREAVEAHLARCTACQAEAEGAARLVALLDRASDPQIVSMAKEIIKEGVEAGASDIHVQPRSEDYRVRHRIHGVLHDRRAVAKELGLALVARIKLMAQMSAAERNTAQDGRIVVTHQKRDYDLRVSSVPSAVGESVVMRVLDRSLMALSLDDIGMSDDIRATLDDLLHRPNGMLVVAGPTGAGKSTTLYAAIKSLIRPEIAISTIEDPVEFQIDGVTQVPVNRKAGLDPAAAMRHVLRQDPDIILCAEIRTLETLMLCVTAAITGHLLLSTMHTDDAIRAIRRMADVGLERFLIAETLLGVLAQRLVRRLCPHCAVEHALTESERQWLKSAGVEDPPDRLTRGAGCEACRGTGYRGRMSIHELLVIDDELRQMIGGDADLREVERVAAGKRDPMRHDAARKVLAGQVAIEEAMRVTAFMPSYD
ncbi:MAG: ATPase, T2SS/T4P/T4SS family [Armatimonadota bacterium]